MKENGTMEGNDTRKIMENAAADIRYLLERDYRRESTIRFASDHYCLEQKERFILARTVFSAETATQRRNKKVRYDELKREELLIDGYNVLITLESILAGNKVWIADDSFLRDIKGVFRNHSNDEMTFRAVEELLDFLAQAGSERTMILLDAQMKNSGELAAFIRKRMHELSIPGDARTSKHVDHDLKNCDPTCVVATADGIIIDSVEKVIDIPGCIYRNKQQV